MEELWYRNAIIYGIDIETFYDSNGDGIGDFQGAIQKMEYLAELGINALWVLPFYPTANKDNGYDVTNYYDIDYRLGNLDDFLAFVKAADKYNIKVIIDLVMHHTSDQHPWFKAARQNRHSRYRDYYIWSDNPPASTAEENIFPGEEKGVWYYDDEAHSHYFHRFYHFEPDLNIANPDVREEMKRVMEFWLDFGIHGFRIDAATHFFEQKGDDRATIDNAEAIMEELREFVQQKKENAVLLAESDLEAEEIVPYIGKGNRMNMIFNFLLNNSFFLALAIENAASLYDRLESLPKIPDNVQWVNFIRNLDELDLERLTDEQREIVFEEFAPSKNMRVYGRGIRRRIAPMLGGSKRHIQLAFSLLMSLPGAPMIIYGDEIGMGDNLLYKGRTCVRTPMQWSADDNAGFSPAPREQLVRDIIREGIFAKEFINAKQEMSDQTSLWHAIKEMIKVRKTHPHFGFGKWEAMPLKEKEVFAIRSSWKGTEVLAFNNLSNKNFTIDRKDYDLPALKQILSDNHYGPVETTGTVVLNSYGYRWFVTNGTKNTKNKPSKQKNKPA